LLSGQLVVICEVKTRRSDRFGAPVEAVNPTKVRRLRRLAGEWLADSRAKGLLGVSSSNLDVRFDVASVTMTGNKPSIDVIEGIL